MCLKTYRFTSSLQFSALWKMLANKICFPKLSCVPPEKILKIPIFRARVHSVIWLEYVSVLFDLVGIFGEFICAHASYFFEKTDVGTGGTTPKRSSTVIPYNYDGHVHRICGGGDRDGRGRDGRVVQGGRTWRTAASWPSGRAWRAAASWPVSRTWRAGATTRRGPARRARAAVRGGPARPHVDGRRVVAERAVAGRDRDGHRWDGRVTVADRTVADGTRTAAGGTAPDRTVADETETATGGVIADGTVADKGGASVAAQRQRRVRGGASTRRWRAQRRRHDDDGRDGTRRTCRRKRGVASVAARAWRREHDGATASAVAER